MSTATAAELKPGMTILDREGLEWTVERAEKVGARYAVVFRNPILMIGRIEDTVSGRARFNVDA